MTVETVKAFQVNKHILYVEDTEQLPHVEHYVNMFHWKAYLSLRKCVPGVVHMFDNKEQLQEFFAKKGILV
jgi:hypothetical protein